MGLGSGPLIAGDGGGGGGPVSVDEIEGLGAVGAAVLAADTQAAARGAIGAGTGDARLASANVFTAPQRVAIEDGNIYVTDVHTAEHTSVAPINGGRGVAYVGTANSNVIGRVVFVMSGDESVVDLRAHYRGASLWAATVGLRVRVNAANCERGVEVLPAPAGGLPIIQPCSAGFTPPNCDLLVRGSGSGMLWLGRPALFSGTLEQITTGAAPFNAPQDGMLALCTDANGGAGALAIHLGGAWLMAPLSPLE